MGSRLDRTVALVLGALLLVAGVLAIPDPEIVSTDRRPSTTRSSPSGVRALYLTLEELEVPVARRMTPLAGAEPVPGALALVAPSEVPSPREVAALMDRVRSGGSLLYAARPRDPLLDSLGLALVPWWQIVAGDEGARFWERVGARDAALAGGPAPEGLWTAKWRPHPWTRGLTEPGGFGRAFVVAGRDEGEGPPGSPPGRPLLAEGDSLVFALVLAVGRGRVVALSDAAPLTNGSIRGSGVAPLVVRAARELTRQGDTLVFDEYHHGFRGGSVRGAVTAFLGRHPAGHALLQLGLVLLGGLVASGRRFGAPLRAPVARRSPLEHVDALARAYRESGARRLPRMLLLSSLARHARRPRPRDEEEARSLLARLRTAAPGVAAELDRIEDALDGAGEDLLAVGAAVDRVTEELRR